MSSRLDTIGLSLYRGLGRSQKTRAHASGTSEVIRVLKDDIFNALV